MWGITKLGVRVIVTHGDVTPVAISNERLFTLKREPPEPKGESREAKPAGAADRSRPMPSSWRQLSSSLARASINSVGCLQVAVGYRQAGRSCARRHGLSRSVTPRETAVHRIRSRSDAGKSRVANTATNTTVDELRPLKPGPISVFISRKEGKLFVRKGFEPVFDVPVTFERPDRPLGTHVFTALALNDDNTTLRWNVVSMPGAGSAPVKKAAKGKKVEVGGAADRRPRMRPTRSIASPFRRTRSIGFPA